MIRKLLAAAFLLAAALVGPPETAAGDQVWTYTFCGGADHNDILCLGKTVPPRVFVGISPGSSRPIIMSINLGETWFAAENGAPETTQVMSFAYVDDPPAYVLAAAFDSFPPGEGGVYRSADGGHSWHHSTDGFVSPDIRQVLASPADQSLVFAGSVFDGVYISDDRGNSWTESSTGLTNLRIQSMAADFTDTETLYAGTLVGLFRSENNGASWVNIGADLPHPDPMVTDIQTELLAPGRVYMAYRYAGASYVVRSEDYGVTWTPADQGMPDDKQVRCLLVDHVVPDRVFAGTVFDGVFKSNDAGTTWTPFRNGLPNGEAYTVGCLAAYPDTLTMSERLFAGTNFQGLVYLRDDPLPFPTPTPFLFTPTPSPNPTPTPHPPGPTPTPVSFGVDLQISQTFFQPGDTFNLILRLNNPDPETYLYPVFVALDVYGRYFFWPSWTPFDPPTHPNMDYKVLTFRPGTGTEPILGPFLWPAGVGEARDLHVLALITNPFREYVIGEIDQVTFGYGP